MEKKILYLDLARRKVRKTQKNNKKMMKSNLHLIKNLINSYKIFKIKK